MLPDKRKPYLLYITWAYPFGLYHMNDNRVFIESVQEIQASVSAYSCICMSSAHTSEHLIMIKACIHAQNTTTILQTACLKVHIRPLIGWANF